MIKNSISRFLFSISHVPLSMSHFTFPGPAECAERLNYHFARRIKNNVMSYFSLTPKIFSVDALLALRRRQPKDGRIRKLNNYLGERKINNQTIVSTDFNT